MQAKKLEYYKEGDTIKSMLTNKKIIVHSEMQHAMKMIVAIVGMYESLSTERKVYMEREHSDVFKDIQIKHFMLTDIFVRCRMLLIEKIT